jgi:hypothetical protein
MGMSMPIWSSTAIFDENFSSTAVFGGNHGPPWTPPPERARRIVLHRAKVNPKTFTSTTTWSNYMRVCQHDGCGRTMGRNGKSYTYRVAPDDPRRDVCHRCHRKLQRRNLRAWRLENFPVK